jgi:hypothetical protein
MPRHPSSVLRFGFAAVLPVLALAQPVALNWLDKTPPPSEQGVTWGVPWAKGKVQKGTTFALTSGGRPVPVQSWPLAYWPDGSLMWTGHAISAAPDTAGPLQLAPGTAALPATAIKTTSDASAIEIDTGALRCRILKQGEGLFESLTVGGRPIAQNGKLIAILEDRSEYAARKVLREEDFVSQVKSVTLEQSGPVRAVVKIEGVHKSTTSSREWLPFTVRFYFYAGQEAIRVVHTFVFDGDAQKDFIKGLGMSFSVPLREEVQNRHVRFGGDVGMWAEPVKPLTGRRVVTFPQRGDVFPDQVAGKRIPNFAEFAAREQGYVKDAADWDAYRLTQLTANGFTIEKRTSEQSSWLHATDGKRALGMAFLGDVTGGVAVSVKKFWQKYPASLEIQGARTASGEVKVWFWSPQAPAMDLRHYDTIGHGLEMAYEDWKEGWDSALGTANTHELTLWPLATVPSNAQLVAMEKTAAEPALLVATPEYYHANRAFGFWSLPDRSTPARRALEDQLDSAFDFYNHEVDQRGWYGFWDYGDMMRQYDEARHQWKYDIGGWAWNNTELLPDYWLWYNFLRTGRADAFRLAEAMTRHTSEVDVHHIGRFAPLGSRHNVNHLGDGAKQPRISQSGLKRFYYFLTADERVGDLMREQLTADFTYAAVKKMDPRMPERGPYASASFGTDWAAYCINWATEYQRTGDAKWLDKIKAGIETQLDLAAKPGQLLGAGPYDPNTGKFMSAGRGGGPTNFDLLFGTVEIMSELELSIDYPKYWEAWHAYAAAGDGRPLAYAAWVLKNPELGKRVWQTRQLGGRGGVQAFATQFNQVNPPDVPFPLREAPGQPSAGPDGNRLGALIQMLEWAGQYLP